ncbi:MAG: alpha/beta hydrolase [Myxococcota bacterium]
MTSLPVRLAAWLSRSFLQLPPAVLARLAPADADPGLDLQVRVALGLHTKLGARPPHRRSLRAARRDMELAACLLAAPRVASIESRDQRLETELGPIPIRVHRPRVPATPGPQPALVYYHGGGFALGSLDSHADLCRELARITGGVIIAVDYRLAPEHPFPAAPDDALAAFRAIARSAAALGLDPRRLALGGDSAGGTLATVVALDTRADLVRPMFQLLIYPAVDLTRSFPSIDRLGRGYGLERATLDWFVAHYAPDPADHVHPRASPWFAPDVVGAPPGLVVTAGFDPLVDEGRAWAERLAAAGVAVAHRDYPTLFHGFASTTGGIVAARAAFEEIAGALRAAWA